MLKTNKFIIKQTTPKSRKEHQCFVCKRPILKGTVYTYEKVIDIEEKWIFERKRHNLCSDPLNLEKMWEMNEKINLKEILAEWKQGEYHPRRAKKKIDVQENVLVHDLFGIEHEAMVTDNIRTITTMVIASSKEVALDKYNALAEERTEYPYFWNKVGLDHVKNITACK